MAKKKTIEINEAYYLKLSAYKKNFFPKDYYVISDKKEDLFIKIYPQIKHLIVATEGVTYDKCKYITYKGKTILLETEPIQELSWEEVVENLKQAKAHHTGTPID